MDTEVQPNEAISEINEGFSAIDAQSADTSAETEKVVETAEKPAESTESVAKEADSATPEAFKPEYKFKAGGKEYEIPEEYRGLIKDKESQGKVKEFFEKAYGLDDLKPRHAKVKEEVEYYRKEVVPQFTKQNEIIKELANYWQKGDFDSYLDKLGDPQAEARLMEWMYKKLSLTPDQKQLYNQNRELQKQLYQTQSEKQSLAQTAEARQREIQQVQEQKILEQLDFTIGKNEFKNISSSYDAQYGEGSFKNKVIQYAQYIQATENKILSPEEAVQGVTQFIKPPAMANRSGSSQVAPKEKPVFPQVSGSAQSPVAKQITSIKQLRQKAHEAQAD